MIAILGIATCYACAFALYHVCAFLLSCYAAKVMVSWNIFRRCAICECDLLERFYRYCPIITFKSLAINVCCHRHARYGVKECRRISESLFPNVKELPHCEFSGFRCFDMYSAILAMSMKPV